MTTIATIIAQATQPAASHLVDVYVRVLRVPLLAGFLTIMSAALAIGAFIWVKTKESVYDKKEYQDRVRALRQINKNLSAVGPLYRFFYHILTTAGLCFIASVLQATLGLMETPASTIVCLTFACIAAISLFVTLIIAFLNVKAWHRFAERTAPANQDLPPKPAAV